MAETCADLSSLASSVSVLDLTSRLMRGEPQMMIAETAVAQIGARPCFLAHMAGSGAVRVQEVARQSLQSHSCEKRMKRMKRMAGNRRISRGPTMDDRISQIFTAI